MRIVAVVFEGGTEPRGDLGLTLSRLRRAVVLDTLERLVGLRGLAEVVLATNFPDLAAEAVRLGVRVHPTERSFHFHRELAAAVAGSGAEGVVYLSGAAAPLLSEAEWRWVLEALSVLAPCVVVNNPQSADLVAWAPADALGRIPAQPRDNLLGYLLRHEAGLTRHLIPNSAAVHFDLDTPTDYLILAESGRAGPRARAALEGIDWDRSRLRAAAAELQRDLAEVALIGRVGTAVVEYLNRYLRLRVRIFSEERGMKALGREEEGLVRSFLAAALAELGPRRFFELLGEVVGAVFLDSRVFFAHGGRRVSEQDRFLSDLGRVGAIGDPWVREFTAAALEAPVPVVLGGHSVVAGGLWVLAEQAVLVRGATGVTYR
ncbi:hypothetical protein [Caldinitratiruptor microaerophilus]|uniref:Uncharacterized protein n=1 Tax=Caldinitratiruptor microaerophilus TaxID=671077 RepID=A0AA35CNG6_9FIRM|nr:hypothetical protein [Caldinitratiruptor microaerophilus]BDG61719.1 hypothetical protein caldi_28090 [Caldinitratiruptor microaerophilus]